MTSIFVDADACLVREEAMKVAARHRLPLYLVTNAARPIRPVADPLVHLVIVPPTPDAADDWIAEKIEAGDVCVTADIPLAARCLERRGSAVAPNGHVWTQDNIGAALAGRELSRHLRELGVTTGSGASFTRNDRSRFLRSLEEAVSRVRRQVGR